MEQRRGARAISSEEALENERTRNLERIEVLLRNFTAPRLRFQEVTNGKSVSDIELESRIAIARDKLIKAVEREMAAKLHTF